MNSGECAVYIWVEGSGSIVDLSAEDLWSGNSRRATRLQHVRYTTILRERQMIALKISKMRR